MRTNINHDVRKLLSGTRAIVSVEGLCRVQLMPSGRILQELAEPRLAKVFCRAFNSGVSKKSVDTERAVAISYEEVYATNSKAMERLGRKRKRTGKK